MDFTIFSGIPKYRMGWLSVTDRGVPLEGSAAIIGSLDV
jgi:hypothetical protein